MIAPPTAAPVVPDAVPARHPSGHVPSSTHAVSPPPCASLRQHRTDRHSRKEDHSSTVPSRTSRTSRTWRPSRPSRQVATKRAARAITSAAARRYMPRRSSVIMRRPDPPGRRSVTIGFPGGGSVPEQMICRVVPAAQPQQGSDDGTGYGRPIQSRSAARGLSVHLLFLIFSVVVVCGSSRHTYRSHEGGVMPGRDAPTAHPGELVQQHLVHEPVRVQPTGVPLAEVLQGSQHQSGVRRGGRA